MNSHMKDEFKEMAAKPLVGGQGCTCGCPGLGRTRAASPQLVRAHPEGPCPLLGTCLQGAGDEWQEFRE